MLRKAFPAREQKQSRKKSNKQRQWSEIKNVIIEIKTSTEGLEGQVGTFLRKIE